LQIPNTTQKETEESNRKQVGRKIVVVGAVASVALWLIVLSLGNPIDPFVKPSESFTYALVVPLPAILLSIIAIFRAKKKRIE